jgi:transcriptional regulator with XRE-family HTH domain
MDEQLNLHIGQRLRARRRALRLSQSDLGAMTQVRFRQIHKYECGQNRTSASVLWKFACALNVPVHYFFEGWAERPATAEPVEIAANEAAANDAANLAIYAGDRGAARGQRYQPSAG